MSFLNLTIVEFFAVLGAISTLVLGLYLLDRSRRRITVATLQFWRPANAPTEARHRRRIQEPLSLILQLIGIALLLAALAQLRFDGGERTSRDHVLILDTSAWMSAQGRQASLMTEAKAQAIAYIRSLSSSDRVMIVRADALATPATVFESNRAVLEDAIRQSQPTASALHLNRALAFAEHVQKLQGRQPGEIVFAGAGRIADREPGMIPKNMRLLLVNSPIDNVGLRKIGLRRSASDPDLWEIYVAVRNYGTAPRVVPVMLAFGGAPGGSTRLQVPPGSESSASFEYRTRAAGWLEARLAVKDSVPDDDRAVLELPAQKPLNVTVYSEEPELFRPLMTANTGVEATFERPAAYDPNRKTHIVVLDRFRPNQQPTSPAVWIEPPGEQFRETLQNVTLTRWNSEHPLGTGLKTRDLRLESTGIFNLRRDEIAVAEVERGPIIIARQSQPRSVLFGFHPLRSSIRYELTTPLLFANILRWISPEIFRRWDVNAGTVGNITTTLDGDWDTSKLQVIAQNNQRLPFSLRGETLQFFSGTPGSVRLVAGDRQRVYSLTLPELGETKWEPPKTARQGVPRRMGYQATAREIWQLLAIAGAAILVFEWVRFGRRRGRIIAARTPAQTSLFRKAS